MDKLIRLVILLSTCFAIDQAAKEVGFTTPAEVYVKEVKIGKEPEWHESSAARNQSVSIKISDSIEKLCCSSLIVSKGSELKFTKDDGLSSANVTVQACEDINIMGKLAVDANISLTLVCMDFSVKDTTIIAKNFSVQANNISISCSTISSNKLNLGELHKTKSILFDKSSTISSKSTGGTAIYFFADNINAHGAINGAYGHAALYVKNDINIDTLRVDFSTFVSYGKSDYASINQGLMINFEKVECNLQCVPSGAAAASSCGQSSLVSNISRLLKTTNVFIKSREKLVLSTKLSSISPRYWLQFSAPIIEIDAEINIDNFAIHGEGPLSPANISISAGVNLLVKNIKLENVNTASEIALPVTKSLYAARSTIVLQSSGVLEQVHNLLSEIAICNVGETFALKIYTIEDNQALEKPKHHYDASFNKDFLLYEPFLCGSEVVKFVNYSMSDGADRLVGLRAISIHALSSTVSLEHIEELGSVYSDSSVVDIAMPEDFKLQKYTVKKSISIDDNLYRHARKLYIYDLAMEKSKTFELAPFTTELHLKNSKIRVEADHSCNLLEVTSSNSVVSGNIECRVDCYSILGGSFDDVILRKTVCLKIYGVEASYSKITLYPVTKEIFVKNSKILLSSKSGLKKVINEYSTIKLDCRISDSDLLDEYIVRGLKGPALCDDSIIGYSKKLSLYYCNALKDDESCELIGMSRWCSIMMIYPRALELLHTKELYLKSSFVWVKSFKNLTSLEQASGYCSQAYFIQQSSKSGFVLEKFIVHCSSNSSNIQAPQFWEDDGLHDSYSPPKYKASAGGGYIGSDELKGPQRHRRIIFAP